MSLRAWNIVVGVCSLVVMTGACGVDYSSLGDSPQNQGAGGGAGAGSGGAAGGGSGNGGGAMSGSAGGGVEVDPVCGTPNPAGCGVGNACAPGQRCISASDGACFPSLCTCAALGSGEWACTKDCGGGQCVAGLPALASAGRLARGGCGPADESYVGLVVGMTERSCSTGFAVPMLILPFDFRGIDGGFELGTHEFSKADLSDFDQLGDGSIVADKYGIGDYVPLDSGTPIKIERASVTLRTWNGGELIAGSYDVVLVDGSRLAGEFDADVCSDEVIICG